jgi:molybdopterin molybdotransferase
MSTMGLDGVLPWQQAHHIARTVGRPLPVVPARLDEAIGAILGAPIALPADDPLVDVAEYDGYALCGEGPWQPSDSDVLRPGHARWITRDTPIPGHTDAVLPLEHAVVERSLAGDETVLAKDPLSGIADERARPTFGDGIVRTGQRASAGDSLVPAGRAVTPAMLAIAAAAGLDHIDIVQPPVVGTIVLGHTLLPHGLPRDGRVRDALGFTVPAFVGRLGARGNPAVRAPDTAELLLREIDDSQADLLITTGSTEPAPDNHVRQVLRDLGARWLIDGVAVTPGAQMLLAKLPDDRFLVGLPGHPPAAMAALITLVAPLIATLRGAPQSEHPQTAVLFEDAPPADFADDTRLAPVTLEQIDNATLATPCADDGPAALGGWANANAVAVIAPGAGYRGDIVPIITLEP